MAFDQATRNRLQRFVNDARRVLEEEFTRQLQNDYGMDPNAGSVADLSSLRHINDAQRETARILRDTLAHYTASGDMNASQGLDRIVREQAFTVLNRLAALRMAEARGLLVESVGNGFQAKGFQLYARLAGTGLGETGDAYRVYLFSVFDELAQDLPGLFDRYSPQGRLFPREAALLQVLNLINDADIAPLWSEDETIGWIYQYFNSKEERKAMREASQAPRNSRELAVRNQFFTPRYVVEFLVDNTLGRLWFNATGGATGLRDRCQYLLVKPDETPQAAVKLRDPRTLKLLDPACGSMHFGLYAFDLFAEIYREAWALEQQHGPGSLDVSTQPQAAFKPLTQTYEDEAAFLRDVPRLIIEHNIYGVDIDPRAAQIASLALWLRAQRAWHDAGVKAKDRPPIGRGHVVAAIAPPAERELRQQFVASLDKRDAELFEKTLQMLKGLPELGVLLQVERELPHLIRQVYVGKGTGLFAEQEQAAWQQAEARLRAALTEFAQAAKATYQGRLFAQDALQGLRLIDLCREVFDVVVMNPPFGEFSLSGKDYAKTNYTSGGHDFITAFVQSALMRLRNNGYVGAITSRTCFFAPTTKKWREEVVLPVQIESWIDLGAGVLDGAMVETCAFCLSKCAPKKEAVFCDSARIDLNNIASVIRTGDVLDGKVFHIKQNHFSDTAGSPFSYWKSRSSIEAEKGLPPLSSYGISVKVGLQTGDDFRFLRCWWEILSADSGYLLHAKGGQNEPFATDIHLVVNWKNNGLELKSQDSIRLNMFSRVNPTRELSPGLTFAYRTNRFSPGLMPKGVIPGVAGMGVYCDDMSLTSTLAILNSSIINELIGSRLANRDSGALYQSGVISPIPFPKIDATKIKDLEAAGAAAWSYASKQFLFNTASLLFSSYFFDPRGVQATTDAISTFWDICREELLKLYSTIDLLTLDAYNFSNMEYLDVIDREMAVFKSSIERAASTSKNEVEKLIQFSIQRLIGLNPMVCSDIRDLTAVELSSYIEGKLLYQRLDANGYPARDILAEEEIVNAAEEAIIELFDDAHAVHSEIREITGSSSLAAYINSPSGYFDDHLNRYSKSRRRAPIYWPLSTASVDYAIWIIYPNLNDQTLYTAVNDFVEPKLKQVNFDLAALRKKGAARTRDDEKQFEALQAFELELIELRDTLLKLAPTYKPNHDDGVQISAAPLWPLFRHKPWQKVLKDTWAKLEKGDYDWAHLAMNYWPDRVREKCKTDKSLAIAHGLEHLYVEPEAQPKKPRGRKKAGGDE